VRRAATKGRVGGPAPRRRGRDWAAAGLTRARERRQISKALDLSQAQKGQLAALWASFEARVARVLAARAHLHQRICATMPNGYMGRDFAVNFLKARPAPAAARARARARARRAWGSLPLRMRRVPLSRARARPPCRAAGRRAAAQRAARAQAHEAMDALKFNLRQEHIVIYDFVSSFHQARRPGPAARGRQGRARAARPACPPPPGSEAALRPGARGRRRS